MRPLRALLAGVALAALIATPVAADQPTRTALPDPPPEFLTFSAGFPCAFPIHLEVVLNREYITSLTNRDGSPKRDLINGSLWIEVVNDDTGATVVLNVGGPGWYAYDDGTIYVTFMGHGLPIYEAVFYGSIGYHAFWLNPDYSLSEIGPVHGQSFDICALID